MLVPGGLDAGLRVAAGAGGGQVVQVAEDGLADPAELAAVEGGAGLAQPAPGHPRAEAQRVLQAVEGASVARRGGADGLEFLQDGPDRAVRLGDVGDEAGHGAGDRVGQPLPVIRPGLARVLGDAAADDVDHLRDGAAEPGPDDGRGLGGKRRTRLRPRSREL